MGEREPDLPGWAFGGAQATKAFSRERGKGRQALTGHCAAIGDKSSWASLYEATCTSTDSLLYRWRAAASGGLRHTGTGYRPHVAAQIRLYQPAPP